MEIINQGKWWQIKRVFHQYEAYDLQSEIRGNVVFNCAKGKRDQGARRAFITQDSFHKYLFYDIDEQLREYFKDYVKPSDRIRIELCSDGPGMWIDPHYDIPEKSLTLQIYLGFDNVGIGKWRLLRIDYVRSFNGGVQNDGLLFRLNLFN